MNNPVYPVVFQGAKPELHIAGIGKTLTEADRIAHKHLHRLTNDISLVIVQGGVGEEGYTNVIDYKLNDDNVIERHIFVPGAPVAPERDTKYREIIPAYWC